MKLSKIEQHLKHGDLIIIKRNRWLSTLISKWTNSKWSHIGIVVRYGDEWFIIDSNERGVEIDFLTCRLEDVSEATIIRPKASKTKITHAVAGIEELCKTKTPYDYLLFLRTAIKNAIRIDLNISSKGFMCTELAAFYLALLNTDISSLKITSIPEEFIDIPGMKTIY
jgi:hypothetical protein